MAPWPWFGVRYAPASFPCGVGGRISLCAARSRWCETGLSSSVWRNARCKPGENVCADVSVGGASSLRATACGIKYPRLWLRWKWKHAETKRLRRAVGPSPIPRASHRHNHQLTRSRSRDPPFTPGDTRRRPRTAPSARWTVRRSARSANPPGSAASSPPGRAGTPSTSTASRSGSKATTRAPCASQSGQRCEVLVGLAASRPARPALTAHGRKAEALVPDQKSDLPGPHAVLL